MLFASSIPFVGRQTELQGISHFCRLATDGDGLVALWIVGEAGIGKSRLIEQAIPLVEEGGAIVLRVRFYPEALSSVFTLLHAAVFAQPQVGAIARLAEIPDPMSVIAAIRRLARLRRVVIVFEDLHVLAEEGAQEFNRLLQGLVHEPIGLVCTSRPGDHPSYQAALPYIVRSITLQPLQPDDLDQLLEHLGLTGGKNRDGKLLHQITRGVPIVLRSILPELLEVMKESSRSLKGDKRIARYLEDRAAMSISSIVREAIGKLDAEAQRGAAVLANLGELFSERAVAILLGDRALPILDRLRQNGVVALPLDPPKPLHGELDEGRIWEFTHSLLHEELATGTPAEPELLFDLVIQRIPLYSNRPILTLIRTGRSIPDPVKRARILQALIEELPEAVSESRSRAIAPIFFALREWFDVDAANFEESERNILYLQLVSHGMHLGMYQPRSQEYRKLAEEFFRATERPTTIEQAIRRAVVLAHNPPANYRDLPDHVEELLTEAEQIIGKFPAMATQSDFVNLLSSIAGKIRIRPTRENIRRLRPYLEVIATALADDPSNEELQWYYLQLAGHILPLFRTEEELADRDTLSERLIDVYGDKGMNAANLHSWGHMITSCGRLREARTIMHEGILRFFSDRPITGMAIQPSVIFVDALLGAPLDYIEKSLNRLLARTEDILGEEARGSYVTYAVALRVTAIARLVGVWEWGLPLAKRMVGDDPHITDSFYLQAFVSHNHDLDDLIESKMVPEDLGKMLFYIAGRSDDREEAGESVKSFLRSPIVYLERVFELRVAVSLLERSTSTKRNLLDDETRALIPDALRQALDWCCTHEAMGMIPPLLNTARGYIPLEELAEYQKRHQRLCTRIGEEFGWGRSEEEKTELPLLKMIGSIAVVSPDGQEQRVQGARGRRILGLMIANVLMDRPQNPEEFRAVAAEGEADSGNTVRVAISRLRGMLGKDAIITQGNSAPMLNLNRFRVDLLEVMKTLTECESAVQTLKPRIAKTAALRALEMVGEEPPYPTLYGEFFEAARLDFELRFRQTILAVARFLRREEDYEEAVDLLRTAFAQMPEDQEIIEELISVLQLTGRNTEAVGVKSRRTGLATT